MTCTGNAKLKLPNGRVKNGRCPSRVNRYPAQPAASLVAPDRYDKLAANYLAFVKLAAIRVWLRAHESTP